MEGFPGLLGMIGWTIESNCFEPPPLIDGFGWSIIGVFLVIVAIRIALFLRRYRSN
jgi:hypothetical protein